MGICGSSPEYPKKPIKKENGNKNHRPNRNEGLPEKSSRSEFDSSKDFKDDFNQNKSKKAYIEKKTPMPYIDYPNLDTPPAVVPIIPNEDKKNNEKDLGRFDENNQIIKEEPTSGDWNKKHLSNSENSFNKKNNQIINREATLYDAIFKCESIKTLFEEGWYYYLTEKFEEKMKKQEEQNEFCPMCFLGETNKGKTFIINLLTDKNLESGSEYKTEGINCKFSNFEYTNYEISNPDDIEKFLIFDTAGRSEPLLIEHDQKVKIKDNLKRIVESNYRDLRITEEFLKNLLINNSQIIIVVVNQLTLSEQIFLYELKNQKNFDQLFIIHNLFNFEKKEDLEDYVDNF